MVLAIIASLVGLFVATLFFFTRKETKETSKISKPVTIAKGSRAYTESEVSLHNSRKDCWIIVKDQVYDVTSYVEEHPGGDSILKNAGRDSTEGFFGPQHGTRVFDIIDDFYIGDLKP
ncbi:cytochrome B5-like protein [Zostera marina]|uniref:Cytochrome B5-like protein n=1 Tax=Zostera marina TaxID=29655 RepID=A0A0K9P4P9_ZOSMR|nr:cytochrome B5-like protein [Zostera marina]KMZ73938.1 cytochrome B5-like protein [Zostera marina]